ncbi:hypothetical protein [Jiella pacifica]|nr:hypothetical protein [Jiella pacifica]
MSAGFRISAALGGTVAILALSYGLALLGEPSSVWLWQMAGAL